MKFKFEGSKEEFEALFGSSPGAPVITPALTAAAPAAVAPEEIKTKYKIGDTVQLVLPEVGRENNDYKEFWFRCNKGQVKITDITDEGYYVEGEMIVQDEHIIRKLGKHALPPQPEAAGSTPVLSPPAAGKGKGAKAQRRR